MSKWIIVSPSTGIVLPSMNSAGRIGLTRSWSSVPISRSRTTPSAVSRSPIMNMSTPMTAGTLKKRLSKLGLNQARERRSIPRVALVPVIVAPNSLAICAA